MGLDTTHDCWHGPYSSFHRWRIWLAKQIGLPLEQMEGFSGDEPGIPWSLIDHPLVPLLAHSDCDGKIRWWDAGQIAIALRHVLHGIAESPATPPTYVDGPEKGKPMWTDWRAGRGRYDGYVPATKRFMRGCIKAYRNREDICFH